MGSPSFRTETLSPSRDDSSQLQSFNNSPDVRKAPVKADVGPPLTDISPVKNPEEEAKGSPKTLS